MRGFWLVLFLALTSRAQAFTLVYSNDVLGEIEPCGCKANPYGGMLRKSGLVERLKKKDSAILQVDAGNLLFDSEVLPEALQEQWKVQSKALLQAHVLLGETWVTPGPKDYALGAKYLREVSRDITVRWISMNLRDSEKSLPEELRHSIGKAHLTVIGYASPQLSYPEGIRAIDRKNDLKRAVEKAKARGDRVLLLSHQGLDADRELARSIPQIDFIVGAHSQSFLQTPVLQGQTRIFQSSFRNQYVGVIRLDDQGHFVSHELIGLDESYEKDALPAMKDLVARFKKDVADLNTRLSLQREKSSSQDSTYASYVGCFECHAKQFDFWRKTSHSLALTSLAKQKQLRNLECLRCHSVGQSQAGGYKDLGGIAALSEGESGSLSVEALEFFHRDLHAAKNLAEKSAPRFTREKGTLEASLRKLKHDFTSVQCENCHGPVGGHPFDTSTFSKITEKTCVSCHTAERAPSWYKDGQLNRSLFARKLKSVACPRDNHGDPDPRN